MTHWWWHRRFVDRYFAGRLGAGAERTLRARMGRCPACRRAYDLHLVAEAALPGGEQQALDRLWRGILTGGKPEAAPAAAAGAAAARAPSRRRLLSMAGALAGAAAGLAGVWRLGRRPVTARAVADPVARGVSDTPARPPALYVFRAGPNHSAVPVRDEPIGARDGLLFAYASSDPRLTHLMVFAVDDAYRIYWYYPPYEHPGENPEAVPIMTGEEGVELREEIRHDLRPGRARLYGLFLRRPARVLEVEALVHQVMEVPRRPPAEVVRLGVANSVETSLLLRVAP
jgi:hypothetical protein